MTMPDERKKIHVNLTDVQEAAELVFKPSEPAPGLKAAEEFQKNLFEYALENRVLDVYCIQFERQVTGESFVRFDMNYSFQKDRDVALFAMNEIRKREGVEPRLSEYKLDHLVRMSEQEFEELSERASRSCYNLVKMYRETMRNILIPPNKERVEK